MQTNNKLREALKQALYFLRRHHTGAVYATDGETLIFCDDVANIVADALAAPPRNCDRPECATTKAAQDVWRKEDGGKMAYYEWLLATATKKEGGDEMRLCEFGTSSSKGTCGKKLFAWARYKRGDVSESGEFAYIDGRVKAKFPNAELVEMLRRFVPASPAEPTEVWWEFKWIVFSKKEGEEK